jgi:protein-S-isoprenylcysteine O-methyltransferase Ste14
MPEWSRVARRIRVPLGFAFAAFYVWIARPSWTSLALGAVVTIPGILLRAFASGYVKKNEELTTSGPYAYTRNPLYLGSLIMAVGFAIAASPAPHHRFRTRRRDLFAPVVLAAPRVQCRIGHGRFTGCPGS